MKRKTTDQVNRLLESPALLEAAYKEWRESLPAPLPGMRERIRESLQRTVQRKQIAANAADTLALTEVVDHAVSDVRKVATERKRIGWWQGAEAVLSASRLMLVELLTLSAPASSAQAGPTLGSDTPGRTPNHPLDAETTATIERTLVLSRAFSSDQLKAALPWLDQDLVIRQQRTSTDDAAHYRVVVRKGKSSSNAVLVITLSTDDGREASAEITATSGKVDWFNEAGAPLPSDWNLLAVQIQVFERGGRPRGHCYG